MISDGARNTKLSPRANAALCMLLNASGGVVRREEFLEGIWPNVVVGEESVTTALSELRRAFGERRGDARVIETVQKSGYRLVAAIDAPDPECFLVHDETFHLEAFTLIQEGRRIRERGEPDRFVTAEALCAEARAIARDYALAHAHHALTQCYRFLYRAGDVDVSAAAESARQAARMRPDLAFTHAVEGYVSYVFGDRTAARRAFGRAVAKDANDFDTHYVIACGLFAMGDFRAAAGIAERAAHLRPEDYQTLGLAARAAAAMGERDRSRADAALALGRAETRLAADPSEPRAQYATCYLRALLGRDLTGCATPPQTHVSGSAIEFYRVMALAQFGEHDAAMDLLEEMFEIGWRHVDLLHVEPTFVALRQGRRFQSLAARVAA